MNVAYPVLWGFLATVAMTTVLQASQGFGWSRLSLPLLVGTFLTGERDRAVVWGYCLYIVGGWLFAFLYVLLFDSVGIHTWWFGALAGLAHGVVLLVSVLPLLPFIHPRMASEYHGVTAERQLEPPGFLAVNYGYGTPLATLAAQTIYGAVLGLFVQFAG